jgi:hypothetical protein
MGINYKKNRAPRKTLFSVQAKALAGKEWLLKICTGTSSEHHLGPPN